jgi:hypothetical protein
MKHENERQPNNDGSESTLSVPVTRREMLLTIGSAAILYGLPDIAAGDADATQGVAASLPPGLYQPSLDHLTHALSSEARFPSIPAGSRTEYVRRPSAPFTPQAFSASDFAIVRHLVELILGGDLNSGPQPHTHADISEWIDLVVATAPNVRAAAQRLSPEHRALAVAYFGNEAEVKQLESFAPDQICREGLVWLTAESHRRSGRSFLDSGPELQSTLVRDISDIREDLSIENAGTRLFAFLKQESIRGFYTSQQGLKELDFKGNHFYARSPGCQAQS